MRLDDCYALLDVTPEASDEELKRAWRDLTKVWHPDRFANDAGLRQKAEEKLKAINDAYETILDSRGRIPRRDDVDVTVTERESLRRRRIVELRMWTFTCAALAVFILLRRPTFGGLLIALALLFAAVVFVSRMRKQ